MAQMVLEQGGLQMIVKEDQADLLDQGQAVFEQPGIEPTMVAEQFDVGPLQLELHRLTFTSLSAQRALTDALLNLASGYWAIENRSYYGCEITFNEEHSRIRSGNLSQLRATLWNIAINLIHYSELSFVTAQLWSSSSSSWHLQEN